MTTPILICDDSSFARKQLARALPQSWDVSVTFAGHGAEAIDAIKAGKGDVLFLDLNMPGMDGYEVLQAIRNQDLPTVAIVVSGDIQPEARERVMKLGALDFVKKPVDGIQINAILEQYGVLGAITGAGAAAANMHAAASAAGNVGVHDGYQEIANVAMGRAADLLARLLGEFVLMPVPKVNTIDGGELHMAVTHVGAGNTVLAVCQGFIGGGIAGEALLIFNQSSFADIAALLKHEGNLDDAVQQELLMDIGSILIGACLKGIAEQLDISFSQGYPVVLGRQLKVADLLKRNAARWQQMLAIEMGYKIENRGIGCDLLLLFTGDSLATLSERVSYLVE